MSKIEEVRDAMMSAFDAAPDGSDASLLIARAAIEVIDADDDAFVHAVGELMHDARFSVSGETYPVVRNFIRALKAAALNEEG